MKKTKRLAALSLALVLALSACGGDKQPGSNDSDQTAEGITDFIDWQVTTGDMTTFMLIYSEAQANSKTLVNCFSSLLEIDNHGKLKPAVATEWEHNEDASVWTFKLRDDVVWVDDEFNEKAKCTAQDWVTAMEWILNYAKNESYNTTMPIQMIAGAKEYYDYTMQVTEEQGPEAAKALKATDDMFKNTVGVEAVDDYTLVYRCTGPTPYFDTVTTAACLYPLSQAQVDELGVDGTFAQQPDTMWYNGPYVIQDFVQNNSKTLVRNPTYWDKDCTLFETYTIKMLEDQLKDDELFMTGEVDTCDLSESRLKIITDNPSNEYNKNLVITRKASAKTIMHFNWAKKTEEGEWDTNWNEAIANEAFRKALYYGMDLTPYWSMVNPVDPKSCEVFNMSTENLAAFSDGKDYVTRVLELLEDTNLEGRYDAAKGQQYKEQAMQELAGKVTFPVQMDMYVAASNQNSLDTFNVMKSIIEGSLGTDFIQLNVKTYVNSARREVYNLNLGSFFLSGWIADYGDPENFMTVMWSGSEGAVFGHTLDHVNECTTEVKAVYDEFSSMAREGSQIYDNLDNRYEAIAQAEAFAINHALYIPMRRSMSYSLTKKNTYTQPYATFGIQVDLLKNIETSTEPYTTEQYEQAKADYDAGKI